MNLRLAGIVLLLLTSLSCKNLTTGRTDDLSPRNSPVQVGDMAPNFSLDDQKGQKVTLSTVRASGPTVLVFYRGNW